jgi:hypothetical protein
MPGFYMIKLNKGVEAKPFTKFMVEELFPDISSRGVTRAGQVSFLQLLSHRSTEPDSGGQDEFLWTVDGMITGTVGADFVEKIEQYGAQVKHLGNFREAGLWRRDRPA